MESCPLQKQHKSGVQQTFKEMRRVKTIFTPGKKKKKEKRIYIYIYTVSTNLNNAIKVND